MNTLIIGGGRLLGSCLIDELSNEGHSVTVFNRGTNRRSYGENIRFIQGDRNDGFNINEAFDVVIDTCAYNATQTRMVIEKLAFKFLIHISTAAVYQKTEVYPLNEESPLGYWPLWGDYARGKIECEQFLKESDVKYASLRPVYILGPNNHIPRESFIYKKLVKDILLVLPGDGKAMIQFVFAKDIATAVGILVQKQIPGAYNCCGNEIVTLKGLVTEMARIVGKKPNLTFNRDADGEEFNKDEFPFANEHLICSNTKFTQLGVTFTPIIEGLRNDYEQYYCHSI